MEYKLDLLKQSQKSKGHLALGLLLLTVGGFWVVSQVYGNTANQTTNWILFAVFMLNGLTNIFNGLGFPLNRLWGKAFVKVDNTSISVKLSALKHEQIIDWIDIQAIKYKTNQFHIEMIDNSLEQISIAGLDYKNVSDIKRAIAEMAGKKSIAYSE